MIHLYAVTASPAPTVDARGVEGAEVAGIDAGGGLYAVASELPRAPATSRDNALRHAEVVAAVSEVVDLLPVRFGAEFADREQLRRALTEDADGLRERLAAVAGRVEFVVRRAETPRTASPPGSPATGGHGAVGSGREYLERRLAEQRAEVAAAAAAARSLAEVTAGLDALAERVVGRSGPSGPERCYLVDRCDAAVFARAAARCCEARDELLVGGPWPPYTFASDGSAR